MGAGAALNEGAGILSIIGQRKASGQSNQGYNNANKQLGTPPIFWKGGNWWDALTGPNAMLGDTAKSLLSGNSLDELQPSLRSADIAGRNNQRSFASQLARSGLTGSGFGLGGNYAIQNQTDVNKSNILAKLPEIQRQNLATLFPYFSRYLGNQEFRSGSLAKNMIDRGNMNAAATNQMWGTAANALGGGGAGKGAGGGGK